MFELVQWRQVVHAIARLGGAASFYSLARDFPEPELKEALWYARDLRLVTSPRAYGSYRLTPRGQMYVDGALLESGTDDAPEFGATWLTPLLQVSRNGRYF